MINKSTKFLLDFEKPIFELEEKLDDLRKLDADGIDLSPDIEALSTRIEELRNSIYGNLTRWQRVQIARHPLRPYTNDYIGALTKGFVELHGDRCFGDDPAIVSGFATLNGAEYGYKNHTVLMIGHQKGRDTKQRRYRRFGMPNPEGYRKARRHMELAAKFGKPIICLLDTPGAYPGMDAEERGQAEAIARNLFVMARLPVPIVVVVIGEGASGGALGIGVGDQMLMLENAWYSVISPESCSSILWRSWDYKEEAARALKLTAPDLIDVGIVDQIVKEPLGGAHQDPSTTYDLVGEAVCDSLKNLAKLSTEDLLRQRLKRLDRIGEYSVAD
ncbi:MAG: acetyl-CoA carboxylase carboxyltransferase subunit alpha [Bacteroidetes bacterium]|nr:acetyl-CoA carboxylase carboxyltransferase subunit alpha [Bacteroidota bacterium]MCY4206139.1 acetyl-CoA carboxylase carboxyltransferase subunit alpha [Bacteroidota bacterium]